MLLLIAGTQSFDFEITEPKYDMLKFTVYDYDKYTNNDFLGEASLSALAVLNCGAEVEYEDWLPLLDKWQTSVKKGARERGDLCIKAVWYGPDLSRERKTSLKDAETVAEAEITSAIARMPPMEQRWEISPSDLKLGSELGRGAFGIVFKAKWRQQDVAVKQVSVFAL